MNSIISSSPMPQTGELESVDSVSVSPNVQKLFEYIRDRGTLVTITNYNK